MIADGRFQCVNYVKLKLHLFRFVAQQIHNDRQQIEQVASELERS